MKKITALITAAAMTAAVGITAAAKEYVPFMDTDSEAVEILSRLEAVGGYDDGSFRPDSNITRAEAAQILIKTTYMYQGAFESQKQDMEAFPENYPEYLFTDLDKSHWSYIAVSIARAAALIDGYEDGSFRPDEKITEEQIVKMAVSSCGYGQLAELDGGYPDGYVKRAKTLGLCESAEDKPATREYVAEVVVNMLGADAQYVTGFDLNEGSVISSNYQTMPYGVSTAAYIAQMDAEIIEAKNGTAKIKIVKGYCLPEYYVDFDKETEEAIYGSVFKKGGTYEISCMYDDIAEKTGKICHLYVPYADAAAADSFRIAYAGEVK